MSKLTVGQVERSLPRSTNRQDRILRELFERLDKGMLDADTARRLRPTLLAWDKTWLTSSWWRLYEAAGKGQTVTADDLVLAVAEFVAAAAAAFEKIPAELAFNIDRQMRVRAAKRKKSKRSIDLDGPVFEDLQRYAARHQMTLSASIADLLLKATR